MADIKTRIRIRDDANKTILINSDQLVYALSQSHPGRHPEYPWMIEVCFVNGEKRHLYFRDEETADRIMDGLYCFRNVMGEETADRIVDGLFGKD